MSAKSLARLAADRDTVPPGRSVVEDSTDVLVAAVPTEALAAYTGVVGVVLSIRTVRSHLDRIGDKTGCRRRVDLTRLALSAELV